MEEDKNFLNDEDWIVHLDEETLLTEASVRGILNFITAGKHSFGQGKIREYPEALSRKNPQIIPRKSDCLHRWLFPLCNKFAINFNVAGVITYFNVAGVITYANNPPQFKNYLKYLQNRFCTVADSFRVGEDFGKIRCQLTYLNKPIFGWKGSYVVCNVSIEAILKYYT